MRASGLGMVVLAAVVGALPADAQQFGSASAVVDGTVMIGEPMHDDRPAEIYLYRLQGGRWVEAGTLSRPEPGDEEDYFGRFIAADGGDLFVGGTTFAQQTGTVWRFRREGTEWRFVERLEPAALQPGDSYGRVGVAGNGLLFVTSLAHGGTGAVWVFRREADGRWVEEATLRPEGADDRHFFGWSLAYDAAAGRLLAGALTPAAQSRGAAYVFRREAPGRWTLEASLVPGEQAPPGLQLGVAVAWHEGRALVGAPGSDGGAGAVQVYERDAASGTWNQRLTLAAQDRQGGAGFGASLHADADAIWVGAPGADRVGRIYRIDWDRASGTYGSSAKLAGIDGEPGDGFGSVITVAGDVAVIGQTGDDYGLGSAVILARRQSSWEPVTKLLGPDPVSLAALTGEDVDCEGGSASLFPCSNVDILSFLPVAGIGGGRGAETNDVWGWTDPETGREYALVGRTDGTSFIDITNPNRPEYLGDLPKTPGSRANIWRDIKVYANHAYVVADGALEHGVQVFDLTRLRDVGERPGTFEPDFLYTGIASAHNIVINEETGFAYAVGANSGGETCGGGLHMIDIREPKSPKFAGCFADSRTGRAGTGYSHDAMCIIYNGPDTEHVGKEVCFGSNESALSIADVSDKANPEPISTADYPNVSYSHQGWITPDHRYFYMNDEGDEMDALQAGRPLPGTRTLIWDVEDLDDPIMVKEHFGVKQAVDHNLYIRGNLMYQSNYIDGLRVLDISDRLNPREVGFLDTVPWQDGVGMDGSWSNYPFFESGTIVVSSGKEGVFFVRYQPRPVL